MGRRRRRNGLFAWLLASCRGRASELASPPLHCALVVPYDDAEVLHRILHTYSQLTLPTDPPRLPSRPHFLSVSWSTDSEREREPLVGVVEERVVEALFRRRPLARVERQHGDEPVGEALRHLGVPLVLLGEDVVEAPRLQLCDVAKLTWRKDRNAIQQHEPLIYS